MKEEEQTVQPILDDIENINTDNIARIVRGIGTTFIREEIPSLEGLLALLHAASMVGDSYFKIPGEEEKKRLIGILVGCFKQILEEGLEVGGGEEDEH